MPEPEILLRGLGIPESPRWHDGRLWFCNWIDRQVVGVSLDGTPEVMLVRDPDSHSMGWSVSSVGLMTGKRSLQPAKASKRGAESRADSGVRRLPRIVASAQVIRAAASSG